MCKTKLPTQSKFNQ